MSTKTFTGEEIDRSGKLANNLVNMAIENTKTPREALLALVRAASTISIVHQIPPKEVLGQIFESMSN